MKLLTPGKFRHAFENSGNPDETAPYDYFDYFFYSNNYNMNQTRLLSEFT